MVKPGRTIFLNTLPRRCVLAAPHRADENPIALRAFVRVGSRAAMILPKFPSLIQTPMKIRLSLLALACALVAAPVQIVAAEKEKEVETELGQKMDKMSSAFRALRRQVKDASKNADSLEKVKT